MTNTLHRQGDKEALKRDYVLFATTTRAKNREGSAPKLQAFLEIARRFKPVSMGNSKYANIWKAGYQEIIDQMEDNGGATVVFDNLPALKGVFLDDVHDVVVVVYLHRELAIVG